MRSRYDVERELRSGGSNRQQHSRQAGYRSERDDDRRSDYGYDEDYERSARSSMDYYDESARGGYGRNAGGYGEADDYDTSRRNERYFSSGRRPSGYGDYEGERPGAERSYYSGERYPSQGQGSYQGSYQNQPYGHSRQDWRSERSGYYGQQRGRSEQGHGDYAGSSSYGRDASGRYGGERGDSYAPQYHGGGSYGMPGDYGNDYGRSDYGRGDHARQMGTSYGTASGYGEGGGRNLGGSLYANVNEDYRQRGESHRGRGPKNYTRSDERIREEISECLADDHSIDASDVEIEVKNGVVTLSGSVDARQLKLRAEDIADHCSGVKDVQNRLTVKARSVGGSQSLAGQGAQSARSEDAGKKH